MITEAARYGQLSAGGSGRNGSVAAATTAAPLATRRVSTNVSLPDLTIAFHDACSNAPNNTAVITSPDNMPPLFVLADYLPRNSGTRLSLKLRRPSWKSSDASSLVCTGPNSAVAAAGPSRSAV